MTLLKENDDDPPEPKKPRLSEGETSGPEPKKPCPGPRDDYLRDGDYFMAVALLSAKRSKDPTRQVII